MVEGYDSDVVVGGIINNTVDVTLRIDSFTLHTSCPPSSLLLCPNHCKRCSKRQNGWKLGGLDI